MVCKTETKEINDIEYSVTQWPVEKSLLMKFRLVKAFGPSITELMNYKEGDTEAEATSLAKAISLVFDSATPEELLSLIKSCVVGVARDGKRITETSFTEHFSGDEMMDVYKVFMFVMKVNYGNLFKGQLAENLLAKTTGKL